MHRVQRAVQQWIDRVPAGGVSPKGAPADSPGTQRTFQQRPIAGGQQISSQPTPLQPGRVNGRAVQAASARAASNGGSSGSDASSATITANDFLTLLVTEIQNQDPTSDTDPNAYINQLVQVNSLEQLISINSELSVFNTSGSSSGRAQQSTASAAGSPDTGSSGAAGIGGAASRVATALNGQSPAATGVGSGAGTGGTGAALEQAARAYASPERRHLPFHAATQQPTGPGVR